MGTRADFYVGTGPTAEWLGSLAYDGYRFHEYPFDPVSKAATADDFRAAVAAELAKNSYATTPEMGWPWPWADSRTSDYAYCFDGSEVQVFIFGRKLLDGFGKDNGYQKRETFVSSFPDMSAVRNVTLGKRSGLIVVRGS